MSKTFAIMSGRLVFNIIVAESKEIAELVSNSECIEITAEKPAAIGWIYNPETEIFSEPEPAEEPAN